jgi:hypothetical protein
VREKEEQIASMQRQIEDLRRKAEQGSHISSCKARFRSSPFEALLRQRFTRDLIEPVPKGEFGGDLIQRVVGPAGQVVGSILWEAKRSGERVVPHPSPLQRFAAKAESSQEAPGRWSSPTRPTRFADEATSRPGDL